MNYNNLIYLIVISLNLAIPAPWKQQDIGNTSKHGHTNFDGHQFKLEGAGTYNDSILDHCHYAYFPVEAECELTVRFVSSSNSQFSRTGLMMRESLHANSPQVSLMLIPTMTQSAPQEWSIAELARSFAGKPLQVKNTAAVPAEAVVSGSAPPGLLWLRLQRKYNSFYAFTSDDGKSWTSLGSTFVEMKKKFYAGITVSSGLKNFTSTAVFDQITIPGWKTED